MATLKQIDNSIMEALRLKIIDAGYWPDEAAFIPGNETGFEAALAAIRSSGKNLIEVYSTGSRKATGKRKNNTVVIRRRPKEASGVGTLSDINYEDIGEGRFNKFRSTGTTYDLSYEITYNCDLEEDADVIEGAMIKAWGGRKKVPVVDNAGVQIGTEEFFMLQNGSINTDGPQFIERGYIFQIWNIDLEGDTFVAEVNELVEVEFGQKTSEVDPESGEPDVECIINFETGYVKKDYVVEDYVN